MKNQSPPDASGPGPRTFHSFLPALAVVLVFTGATNAIQDGGSGARSIDEMRLNMGKMIETQQIISKERNDWTHGKEILQGRLELVRTEIASLEAKIAEAQAGASESTRKREELLAESSRLAAIDAQLKDTVTRMEAELRTLLAQVPQPILTKLDVLIQRIPADPAETRASAAERFQNVLGILNELNRANGDITVEYEVRELADGRPSEVRVLYVGLAQAYYVSASGEAGIGRPTSDGWRWEPSKAIAGDVLTALEIIQGKHTPAFVPLPVHLQ